MKTKKLLYLSLYLLSFSVVVGFIGCDESNDPPPVVNQPPVIEGLDDFTLSPGFVTHELDFANYVTDLEGEIITYQVTNSNNDVITISLLGSVLTITEVGIPGSSDITLVATDGNEGNEATHTFTVTVEPINGADDYTGSAAILVDFNGLTEGSVFDNPIPGWLFEGNTADNEYNSADIGSILVENDHLFITHNVEETYIWSEMELDGGNQDYTGKKFRFDYRFFTSPNLTDTHWNEPDDVLNPTAVDIRIYFVDDAWGDIGGGQYRFSSMSLEYSNEWQAVEIPLSEFESMWGLSVEPSAVGVIGLEVWGGSASGPISFRIDNFGIVD
jgi:hypothetical protein